MNGEINSPILKDCKSSWKELKNVLEMLIKNEGMVSEKCGGHVNIGANILKIMIFIGEIFSYYGYCMNKKFINFLAENIKV